MEVQKEDSDKVEVIYLNANNTRYELKDILPNTKYNLKFKYTATEEGQTIIKEFSNTTISTQKPKLSLKVTRTRVGEITYVITTDNSYKLTKADLVVTIKDSKTGETRKRQYLMYQLIAKKNSQTRQNDRWRYHRIKINKCQIRGYHHQRHYR